MLGMAKYPKQIVAIVALSIAWLFVIAGPNNIQYAPDYQSLHLIHKIFLKTTLLAGEMPFWNPYQMLGRPFLADPETAIFYPTTLLYLFLPLPAALLCTVFVHLFIAGNYIIELARKLEIHPVLQCVAAILFMLNGTLVMRLVLGQPPPFIALTITPWLLCATLAVLDAPNKKNYLKLIIPLTLSFLAGHTQFYWIHIIGLSLFILGYQIQKPERHQFVTTLKSLATFYGCVLVSLGLSGMQLIPSIEFFLHSHRNTETLLSFSQTFSITGLASLALPIYNPKMHWNEYFFPGTLIFTLAILAPYCFKERITRGLLVVAFGSLILALGAYSPLFDFWNTFLPGYKFFRGPVRIALWLVPVLVLLGTTTLSNIFTGTYKKSAKQLTLALLLTMVTFICAPWAFKENYPWTSELFFQGLGLGLVLVMVLLSLSRRAIQRMVICLSLLILGKQFALALHAKEYFPLPPDRLKWEEEMQRQAARLPSEQPQPIRIAAPESRIRANTPTLYGLANLNCFAGMHPDRTWRGLHLGMNQEPTPTWLNQPSNNLFSDAVFPAIFAIA